MSLLLRVGKVVLCLQHRRCVVYLVRVESDSSYDVRQSEHSRVALLWRFVIALCVESIALLENVTLLSTWLFHALLVAQCAVWSA